MTQLVDLLDYKTLRCMRDKKLHCRRHYKSQKDKARILVHRMYL
jgi:hypothetical protein